MIQQKFPIAIYQKPTIIEGFFVILFALIIFVPFIYGIKTKQPIFCLSMIIGIICFKIFNETTKSKFLPSGIIKKDILISFSENGIEISSNEETTEYKWSNLQEIEINIYAYKQRYYTINKYYYGYENSIKFMENGEQFKYRFYIENVDQFKLLKKQFSTIILPLLNEYQNLKEESYLQAQFNFARNYNNLNNDTDYI
ncbi:hypothetical protein HNP37_000156 [Flavobacterium nitrogenifigens]|uniref:Uncharacterized protein n=2 Tax=Flavobacterium TaxID=237 RepID=A0A7W7N6C9_9FLAO|nr:MULTISPECIES: hypothetical protein [Flavobacterium]MBB4800117.1 hypothetical protein [Flavobacterium nitrogenifigens]MBB6386133.1 hypothetical protein [Flavobacterium notoginsengisoli]